MLDLQSFTRRQGQAYVAVVAIGFVALAWLPSDFVSRVWIGCIGIVVIYAVGTVADKCCEE